MNPEVSIVVPTRNRLKLLPLTLSSLFKQEDVAFEIIVVDDGSTDGTEAWLGARAAAEPRLRVERHSASRGVSAARNRGIAAARGRWVAFCDDDDLWAPQKLSAQIKAMADRGVAWSCTSVVIVDNDLRIVGHQHVKDGDILANLLNANVLPGAGSAVIAETDLVRSIGGFDETLSFSEDWDLWIRVAQRSALAGIDAPLTAYRQTVGSASSNVGRMRDGRNAVLARYEGICRNVRLPREDENYERFLAKQLIRTGARASAAAIYAGLMIRHRNWRDAPRALMAFTAPRLMHAIGNRQAAAKVPQAWRIQAERWLRDIQASAAVPVQQEVRGI